VEDLFYLGNRSVEQIPERVLPSAVFENLVAAGARVGVLVEHREAFRSVAIFLENAIALGVVDNAGGGGDFKPYVAAVLQRHGEVLFANLVAGAAGGLPSERVSDEKYNGTIAHVLFVLFEFMGIEQFSTVLRQALVQPGCAHLSDDLRRGFVDKLANAALGGGKHLFINVVGDFGYKARRKKKRSI